MGVVYSKRGVVFTIITLSFIVLLVIIAALITNSERYSSKMVPVQSRARSMTSLSTNIERDLERAVYISGFRALLGLNDWIRNASSYNDQPEFVPDGGRNISVYVRRVMTSGIAPVVELNNYSVSSWNAKIPYRNPVTGEIEKSKFMIVYNITQNNQLQLSTGSRVQSMFELQTPSTLPEWIESVAQQGSLAGLDVHMDVKRVKVQDPMIWVYRQGIDGTWSVVPVPYDASITSRGYTNAVLPYDITVRQSEYGYVEFVLYYSLNISDRTGVADIRIVDKEVVVKVPITNLQDPLYSGMTGGKLQNRVQRFPQDGEYIYADLSLDSGTGIANVTPLAAYLEGPSGHSYYRPSPSGPSFLERFYGRTVPVDDGMLNPGGLLGIESFVNADAALDVGQPPLNKPLLDWVYFNDMYYPGRERDPVTCPTALDPDETGCAIDSLPSAIAIDSSIASADQTDFMMIARWLKSDCCALERYGMLDYGEPIIFYRYFSNLSDPTIDKPTIDMTDPSSIQNFLDTCELYPCLGLPVAPSGHDERTECNNNLDDDFDGGVDWNGGHGVFAGYPPDSQCSSALDSSEKPECSDGIDNDGDTAIDQNDRGCTPLSVYDPSLDAEDFDLPHCRDGIDNDEDGLIDYDINGDGYPDPGLSDDGCQFADDWSEKPDCSDGVDNDFDLLIDENDPECDGVGGYNPLWPFEYTSCSDGEVDPGENCHNCQADVPCASSQICSYDLGTWACRACSCRVLPCPPSQMCIWSHSSHACICTSNPVPTELEHEDSEDHIDDKDPSIGPVEPTPDPGFFT